MSGPVQEYPQGLLSLFGLKTLGRNPGQLADVYSPSLEVRDWLLNRQPVDIALNTPGVISGTVGLVGFTPTMTVPPGEFWWVERFLAGTGALAAGDVVALAPCIVRASATFHLVGPLVSSLNIATGAHLVHALNDRGFWCGPGTELVVYLASATTAAPFTVFGRFRYKSLQV